MKINCLTGAKLIAYLFICTNILYACNNGDDTITDEPAGKTDDDTENIDTSNMTLKDVIGDKFLFGAAVQFNHVKEQLDDGYKAEQALLQKHFNAVVAESNMKWANIHPEKDRYDWEKADAIVQFAIDNNMTVTGHTLIWHTTLPDWVWKDATGKDVSPEVLKMHMKEHITTVMKRYKGRIKGWDVVNEAFNNDGSYRETPFYRILGKEYIPLAFQYAQAADPDTELYYNDFELYYAPKRQAVLKIIGELKERGIRIDAIGLQGHMWMDTPKIDAYENTILAFKSTDVKVMITEWDISVVAGKDLYPNGLPKDIEAKWTKRVSDFFKLFLRHKDVITRVTTWGISDSHSWKNDGCTDYPLLFDRKQQPKTVVDLMIKAALVDK